jgi:hypothetical protein
MSDSEAVSEENKDYIIPQTLKRLRACTRCHLIKTEKQVNIDNS